MLFAVTLAEKHSQCVLSTKEHETSATFTLHQGYSLYSRLDWPVGELTPLPIGTSTPSGSVNLPCGSGEVIPQPKHKQLTHNVNIMQTIHSVNQVRVANYSLSGLFMHSHTVL